MTEAMALPRIIQGGMGIAVSNWRLANAVSSRGQLGVVSGTALDTVFVRRLQDGDIGGHMRRAMERFPIAGVADAVLERYFRPEGKPVAEPYKLLPVYKQTVTAMRTQITMLANFVEVWLAKEGHGNPVGLNLLTKIQMPNIASLYGAMMAGVDFVIMGAGIPREIPGVLDALAEHKPATMRFDVEGLASGEVQYLTLDPATVGGDPSIPIKRPMFLPIISANSLATTLARKANGRVDGFVVEGWTAGGHNAPPRGTPTFNERGEPIYGERDTVDLAKLAELGLPFWVAGSEGSPERLKAALDNGAVGIQVGTLFAFADESGFTAALKHDVLKSALVGKVDVLTDAHASPTGYPFKVVRYEGDANDASKRKRICDLGYLRNAYKRDDGRLGYRCASEPVDDFVQKGGAESETTGRRCLCNALEANIGQAQHQKDGMDEPPLLTSGDDLMWISKYLKGRDRYTAGEVLDYLLSPAEAAAPSTSA